MPPNFIESGTGGNPIQEIEPDQEANEGNRGSSDQYRFLLRPFWIALIDQLDHAQRHPTLSAAPSRNTHVPMVPTITGRKNVKKLKLARA